MFPFFSDNGHHLLRKRFLFIVAAAILSYSNLSAQISLDAERQIKNTGQDSLFHLQPWILPESFQVRGDNNILPESTWTLYPVEGVWSWNISEAERARIDTLSFQYRYWPLNLPTVIFEREMMRSDTTALEGDATTDARIVRRPLQQQDLFRDTQLQRSGSLRRGIVAGTNQDFSMESGLHFEVSGRITDDIEVSASLTDRSTPIQPDGTTQTLREFDQVYIRLKHEMGLLQMGDIDIRLDQSNFAVIDRRLQGVGLQADLNRYGSYESSAAVVRGRYREMQFNGIDGVQGPYRLAGSDNQELIIVLAGSERVFINGERMTRGEENDYIVDYGLGEITFTSNRIITDHSRVTVDFQYLRDAYTRSVVAADAAYDHFLNDRLSFGASVIRESDNVNISTQLFLTDFEREVLEQAGNDPEKAVVSGADSVGFRRDADFLLYSKTDTLFDGRQFEIFKHIPGDSSGVFRVQFSRVADGSGDYRRVGRAANGILFEWAGPGMGNYMPQRRLEMPVEHSMVALRSRFNATRHLSVHAEWAGSHQDQNRLSNIQNEQNNDMGLIAGINLSPFEIRLGKVFFDLETRYEGKNFAYFDRVREVEFDRKWNLAHTGASEEKRLEGTAGWAPANHTQLNIGAGVIERTGFQGTRGEVRLITQEEGLPHLDFRVERVESDDRYFGEKGNWWRHRGRVDYDISLPTGSIRPEFEIEQEERLQKITDPDSLLASSFRFLEVGPGLYYHISDRLRAGSTIRFRQDYGVQAGELQQESIGITQQYVVDYRRGSLFHTRNTMGLRQRRFEEVFRIEQQRLDSRGVLIRSVTDYRPWNSFIDAQLLYDANTERRPLLQEAFIEAGPELGQYNWIDLNNDGVQQVDEFFPEQSPNEGTFIKQLVPSEELFPVIALRTRLRMSMDPSRLIDPFDARYSSWLDFLSGIRWHTVVDIREDNRTQQLQDIYLLRLHKFRDDSLTINGRWYMEQDIEFFRNNTRRELRFTGDRMMSQSRQASGLEHRKSDNYQVRFGGRITGRYRFLSSAKRLRNENLSEAFASRNYSISGWELRPRLDVRWNRVLQSGAGVSLVWKRDSYPQEPSKVRGSVADVDARITTGRNIRSVIRIERRNYNFSGMPSSSLGQFELTEGAGMGLSWAWSVQADYRISDFLRASLQYDGRTVSNREPIQTLRFTINAVF